jgi:putative alpha-1,2-mannosidase
MVFKLAAALAALAAALVVGARAQYAARTNLRIGTGGGGWGIAHNPPGAQLPFSPLRLSPDTSLDALWIKFNHHGGYYDRDTHIRAFSHTHFVGCGGADWGNFGVMVLDRVLTNEHVESYGYRSVFDADAQEILPGYYAVPLPTHRVARAELTAAGHFSGLHRYTFEASAADAPKTLLVDVCHSLNDNSDSACAVASAAVDLEANWLTASIKLRGSGTGRTGRGVDVHFCGRLAEGADGARAQATYGTWKDGLVLPNSTAAAKGEGEPGSLGLYVTFAPSSGLTSVTLQAGISFLSVDQACANLAADVGACGTTFDACRARAVATWDAELGGILEAVELRSDQSEDDAISAYTALYRSLQSPTRYTEVNGQYVGFDGVVRTSSPGTVRYSDLSLWDTFRTQHPLLVLVRPDVALGCVQSMVDMAQEGTDLPRWALANLDTSSMLGDSSNSVIVDLLRKLGPDGWNTTVAYEKMRIKAMEPRPTSSRSNIDAYLEYGYIPVDVCQRCSSHSLHYYYDDWAIGLLAEHLGLDDDAAVFFARALNYSRLYDPVTQFMQPRRRDGSFVRVPPEQQVVSNEVWVEGNTAHYTFFVQHDPEGLIALFPSPEVFVAKLVAVFQAYVNAGPLQAANILPNVGYWGGNEPSLFHPFLFSYAGRPDLTQYWTRYAVADLYRNTPGGVPGNDDFGTLSAWFTFAATLGLYPNPPHTHYVLTSPLFARVVAWVGPRTSPRRLEVLAHNNTRTNVYVTSVLWNGTPLASYPFIEHADVVAGGTLEFFMAETPAP